MSGPKAYTMREMKAIVDYLEEHKAYSEYRGRKMWMDFANSSLTTRTWQSLKETFLKRILPDIQNPYYQLTRDQVCSFRQGYDVAEKEKKNRLEIQRSSQERSTEAEKQKNSEQPLVTQTASTSAEKRNEVDKTAGEDFQSEKISARNRSSAETLIIEEDNHRQSNDNSTEDLEADPKGPSKTMKDCLTFEECESPPVVQAVLDDFGTDSEDSEESPMEIVESTNKDANENNANDQEVIILEIAENVELIDNALIIADGGKKVEVGKTFNPEIITEVSPNDLVNWLNGCNAEEEVEVQTENNDEANRKQETSNTTNVSNAEVTSSHENPCLNSVSLFEEQFNTTKYIDSEDEETPIPKNDVKQSEASIVNNDVSSKPNQKAERVKNNKLNKPTQDKVIIVKSKSPTQNQEAIELQDNQSKIDLIPREQDNACMSEIQKLDNKEAILLETDETAQNARKTRKIRNVLILSSNSDSDEVERVNKNNKERYKRLSQAFGFAPGTSRTAQRRRSFQNRRARLRTISRGHHEISDDDDDDYIDIDEAEALVSPPHGRRNRRGRVYKKPETGRIIPSEEEGQLFLLLGNKVYPVVSDAKDLNYVHYDASDAEEESIWRQKYIEQKRKATELKKNDGGTPIAVATTSDNKDSAMNIVQSDTGKIQITLSNNNEEKINLEGHWPQVLPIMQQVMNMFYKPDNPTAVKKNTKVDDTVPDVQQKEDISGRITPIIPIIPVDIASRNLEQLEREIVQEIEERGNSIETDKPEKISNVTKRNDGGTPIAVATTSDNKDSAMNIVQSDTGKIQITLSNNNEEKINLEGHWPQVLPIMQQVMNMFYKPDNPTAVKKNTKVDDTVPDVQQKEDISGRITPIIPIIPVDIASRNLEQLEREIVQEIEERGNSIETDKPEKISNVTKRKARVLSNNSEKSVKPAKNARKSNKSVDAKPQLNPTDDKTKIAESETQDKPRKSSAPLLISDTSSPSKDNLATKASIKITEKIEAENKIKMKDSDKMVKPENKINVKDSNKMEEPENKIKVKDSDKMVEPENKIKMKDSDKMGNKRDNKASKIFNLPSIEPRLTRSRKSGNDTDTSSHHNKRKITKPKADSDGGEVRYMLPPGPKSRKSAAKQTPTKPGSPENPHEISQDRFGNSVDSTQGYQDSDASPMKNITKRKKKLSLVVKKGKHYRRKSFPSVSVDELSLDSSNSSYFVPKKSISHSTLDSEIYKTDSYRILIGGRKLSITKLDAIEESSKTDDVGHGNAVSKTSNDSVVIDIGTSSSSIVSLPFSPELSVVENLSISREMVQNISHPTINEHQSNDSVVSNLYNQYLIADVDVSVPLMQQDCALLDKPKEKTAKKVKKPKAPATSPIKVSDLINEHQSNDSVVSNLYNQYLIADVDVSVPLMQQDCALLDKPKEKTAKKVKKPKAPATSPIKVSDLINEHQSNDSVVSNLYNQYLIADVDVSVPLMQQDCALLDKPKEKTAKKVKKPKAPATSPIKVSDLLNKVSSANLSVNNTLSDTFDQRLRNLLLESAKKMTNTSKENLMEVDEPTETKKAGKKRSSTPRKRVTKKSKATVGPVIDEHRESCAKAGRQSCPPLSTFISLDENANNSADIQLKPKKPARIKKNIIRVKIQRPTKATEVTDRNTSQASIYTDSSINESVSINGMSHGNDNVELIHNHSETCLQAHECIGNSIEFVEELFEGQESPSMEFESEEKRSEDIFATPATTAYHSPVDHSNCSLITEDLSDELPSPPRKWYLLTEEETNTCHTHKPEEMTSNMRSSNYLKQIFPIACAVPDLSTISEMSKENENSRKTLGEDTESSGSLN